jgi:hypothetical protein
MQWKEAILRFMVGWLLRQFERARHTALYFYATMASALSRPLLEEMSR